MTATRSLRSRVSWSATLVVGLWIAVLTVGANVLLVVSLARQVDDVLLARAEAVASTVSVSDGGEVTVTEAREDDALDVDTWVFDAAGRAIETPPGHADRLTREAAALSARVDAVDTADVGLANRVRLLALPVRADDDARRIATVVTTTSLTPYDELERLAGIGSAVLAVLLLVVIHLALRAGVARALRPVREMTAQAGRWSADDVDRRFGDDPRPAELAELAETLDGVLDRLAAVLRHERQLSDELSHELRTPLTRLQAELDLLRQRRHGSGVPDPALDAVDEAAGSMRDIVETLMTAARSGNGAAPGRSSAAAVLERVLHRCGSTRPELGLDVRVPVDLVVGVDAAVLERMVAPVVENAVRYARRRVEITGGRRSGRVQIDIVDDGPGVPVEDRERVFTPGWRAEAWDGHDGAGLGLALARRLALAAGAQISVDAGPGGAGARFLLDLPAG